MLNAIAANADVIAFDRRVADICEGVVKKELHLWGARFPVYQVNAYVVVTPQSTRHRALVAAQVQQAQRLCGPANDAPHRALPQFKASRNVGIDGASGHML